MDTKVLHYNLNQVPTAALHELRTENSSRLKSKSNFRSQIIANPKAKGGNAESTPDRSGTPTRHRVAFPNLNEDD